MLVDAEHLGTGVGAAFGGAQAEEIVKPALHGGAANGLSLRQPAAADAVPMLQRDPAPERLSGPPARQNPWKSLPKAAATLVTPPLASLQFQLAVADSPALMPESPHPPVLQPQVLPATVRTGLRPGIPGRNPHSSGTLLDACNLVSRQADYRL